ncbi:MAG: DUF1177 domain-containing protein [Bacillota bacterium]|nr:DUF1177 domain-containing protein [Bacillota bacterium]
MLKQTMEVFELLDAARVDGERVAAMFQGVGLRDVAVETVQGERGSTDFVRLRIVGRRGRSKGGDAPTLGLIGQLGGIGARPARVGLVSDGDGAVCALACALKLTEMQKRGDILDGDVQVVTHICPNAPTTPHEPVPFMGSPIGIGLAMEKSVLPDMEAILSIDTTRGNRVINHRGFAISPTVKEGYVLRVSDDLLDLMSVVTGRMPTVLPISTQDITPYGNGLYHINSIMQPATATSAPVVGVAITAEIAVPGCATGASQLVDIASAAGFCMEVAKAYGSGHCRFYDPEEWDVLQRTYGSLKVLQSGGYRGPGA